MRAKQKAVPGDVVGGKYRIEERIGEGGMGYVHAAFHLVLRHRVALKFMRGQIASDEARERFFREARSVARLSSPHVARVLDVGAHEGDPFIAMELLTGKDLAAILDERGALPVAEACSYVVQACEALAEAHREGIIHRDLKPANLFVTEGFGGLPMVKVLDFGVSKLEDGDGTEDALTAASALLGSPSFMAPEQLLSAHDADRRSDVWSLGVILFCLLTGSSPFPDHGLAELVARIVRDPIPDLRDVRPDLPHGLARVVARCLERDRSKRIGDCVELAALLAPWTESAPRANDPSFDDTVALPGSRPSTTPPPQSRPDPLASGVVAKLAVPPAPPTVLLVLVALGFVSFVLASIAFLAALR